MYDKTIRVILEGTVLQAKQIKRQQMLNAARMLFTDNGFERTTMQKIADNANVGVATLFRYFPKKELLIIEVVKEVIEEMVPQFEAIAHASKSGYDKIEAILDAYIQYIFSANLQAVTLLESFEYYMAYNPVEEKLLDEIRQSYTKIGRLITHSLQQGSSDGSITSQKATHLTIQTIMNIFGTAIKKHAFISLLPDTIVPIPSKEELNELKFLILSYLKNKGDTM